jgi:aspartate dehydrogenase
MSKPLRIGIVGCGAIGTSLAKIVVRDFKKKAQLTALYDIDEHKSRTLSRILSKKEKLQVQGLKALIAASDLVVEASSATAAFGIAQEVLKKGREVLIMSVGGVAGREKELAVLCRRREGRVYIPSGAICGIDALKAVKLSQLNNVTLITTKHPSSFKGVKYIQRKRIDLEKIKSDKLLFSGTAEQAVKFFPQNINVAGILSMAGLGKGKTTVKIIASPAAQRNIHEVRIESSAATIVTRAENLLHPDNPKTSYLAVLSAAAALKQIFEPIRIGT